MVLACHMRLRDHVIRGSCEFMDSNLVSYGPARFGGHRHCGSGDIFLVAEEETLGCSCFNPPLLFNFSRTWVESAPHIILLTPILVTRSHTLSEQILENIFYQSVQKPLKKEKKKKKGNCKASCAKAQREKRFF